MAKLLPQNPSISINIKDSVLMIHKNTLRILGSPEYIQILVNPDEKTIVLCCSNESDHLAHYVRREIFTTSKKTYRLHSCALVQGLHKIYPKFISDHTYKIHGKFIENLNIIKFDMNNSILSSNYEKGCIYE